jgi:3-dehydroquinate dehydratase / shikimate dehydrogenase
MVVVPPGRVAVAIGPKTMAEALELLPRAAAAADVVELRLDAFEEPFELAPLLARRGRTPLVATLRPVGQGGRSRLPAPERLRALLEAADLGAEYVDLEWDAATPEAVAALKQAGATVLVSYHDLAGVPDDLAERWWPALLERGADVVKLAGTAHDVRDCLPVFRALRRATAPTVAMAMGAAGLPTRVLGLRERSCFLTYGALDGAEPTAPGQPTLGELLGAYRAARLGPSTEAYGLLGPHLETSMAAQYNGWFAGAGVDAVAVPFVADAAADSIVRAYRELPVAGWHVHGEGLQRQVVGALDELSAKARRQGKVNAVTARGAALVGDWVESPGEQFAAWTGRAAPELGAGSGAAPAATADGGGPPAAAGQGAAPAADRAR